jgi:hypothetical protein
MFSSVRTIHSPAPGTVASGTNAASGVRVAHTVPHPPGQLPGQKYVSSARQAGGVHTGANISVGGRGNGDSVSVTGGVGTNNLHASSMSRTGIADNRFIAFAFLWIGTLMHAEGESR